MSQNGVILPVQGTVMRVGRGDTIDGLRNTLTNGYLALHRAYWDARCGTFTQGRIRKRVL